MRAKCLYVLYFICALRVLTRILLYPPYILPVVICFYLISKIRRVTWFLYSHCERLYSSQNSGYGPQRYNGKLEALNIKKGICVELSLDCVSLDLLKLCP